MKYLNKFYQYNESKLDINWSEVEEKWDNWIESCNNEQDYEDEFKKLKLLLGDLDLDFKKLKSDYYDYIEQTNNEDDPDVKFRKFKKMVTKK
jgi:hypothetical protein